MRKLIFLSLLLVIGIQAGYAQDDDLPPYLYYYSDVLNAFVIERADGTDSRILGAGLMPRDTNTAIADWSPSGEWLAWRSSQVREPMGNIPFDGWIVKADGSARLTFLDEHRVAQIAWSPTEDLLFAAGYARHNPDGTIFYLIDVAQQRIITAFTLDDDTHGTTRNVIRWSPDGRTVSFYYNLLSQEDSSIAQSFMRTVTREGVIQDNEIRSRVGIGDVWQVATPFPENRNNLNITPDGSTIVIENSSRGETRELDNPTESTQLKAEWNSTGEFALVFAEYACEPISIVCAELWLLSMEPLELIHISDTAAYARYVRTEYWSPVQDVAHFTDVDGNSLLFNTISREIVLIDGLKNVQVIHWSPDGWHLLAIGDSYSLLELESLQTQDVTPTDLQLTAYEASFSANSQYLAMAHPLHILDLETGEVHVYPAHSSAMNAGTHSYEFLWSPDQEWIVYSHVIFHAGGGGGPRANIVTNIEGAVWRELSVAFNQAEWLPERVIPHLLSEQE